MGRNNRPNPRPGARIDWAQERLQCWLKSINNITGSSLGNLRLPRSPHRGHPSPPSWSVPWHRSRSVGCRFLTARQIVSWNTLIFSMILGSSKKKQTNKKPWERTSLHMWPASDSATENQKSQQKSPTCPDLPPPPWDPANASPLPPSHFLLLRFQRCASHSSGNVAGGEGSRLVVFFFFPQRWKGQASYLGIEEGKTPLLLGQMWAVEVIFCVSRPSLMFWSRWSRGRCCSWTFYPSLSATPPSSFETPWEPRRSPDPQNHELLSWSGSSSSELQGPRWVAGGCFRGESGLGPSSQQILCRFA